MVAVSLLAALHATACGRVGFDPLPRDAASHDGAIGVDGAGIDGAGVSPWPDGWTARKPIDFESSMVPSTLDRFPVFVGLAMDADLAATATGDGVDIRFTKSDGITSLPFEIERFDPSTGRLAAWVHLAQLSSTADTRIYLYYGNATAPAAEDPARVWEEELGVWHLGEAPTVDPAIIDARGGTNLTSIGAMTAAARVEGKLGWAIDFDGVDDRLSAAGLPATPGVSVSAWVRPRAWPSNLGTIVAVSTMAGANNHDYFIRAGMDELNFGIHTGTDTGTTSGGWSELDTWHFVAGTFDGITLRLYQDGLEVASTPWTGAILDMMRPFHVGSWGVADPQRTWNGVIDEVRVSSVVRSADWYRTRFANESDPGSFHRVGSEERQP